MNVWETYHRSHFPRQRKCTLKQQTHTEENLYCLSWHNFIQLCQTSRTYRWGNDTLKLTVIITSQRKIMNRYLYLSLTLSAEDFKALANGRSRSSLSTPCNGRLPFVFRLTRRVAQSELFIGQLIPFTSLIQPFFFNDQYSRVYHTILAISLSAFI